MNYKAEFIGADFFLLDGRKIELDQENAEQKDEVFKIAPTLFEDEKEENHNEKDLSELTVAELKTKCDEAGIEYAKKATKAQLLEALNDADDFAQ